MDVKDLYRVLAERKQVNALGATVQMAHLDVAAEPAAILGQAKAFVDACAERLDRQQIRCS